MENKNLLDLIANEQQDAQIPLPAWLLASRQHYTDHLKSLSAPTQKHEHFRYINLTQIYERLRSEKTANTMPVNIPEKLTHDSIRLIFIDNEFQPNLSDELPAGIEILSLMDALTNYEVLLKTIWTTNLDSNRYPFAALTLALFHNGLFFHVSPNSKVSKPLHFLHIFTKQTSNPLRLYYFGEMSEINLFEEFISQTDQLSLKHDCNLIYVDNSAKLKHTNLSAMNQVAAWQTMNLTLQDHAETSFVSCVCASDIFRQDMICHLIKPFAHCKTSGFYHAKQSNYIDHHLEILHLAPHTTSDMLFKGTLYDTAKAVFNGRLYVEKQAQKITAFQGNHHLIFSNQAESYSKPELEIHADDVKCKHGATTAAFDQDALFYLRSRGLSHDQAKKLMLDAFFESIIDRISLPPEFIAHIKIKMEEGTDAI